MDPKFREKYQLITLPDPPGEPTNPNFKATENTRLKTLLAVTPVSQQQNPLHRFNYDALPESVDSIRLLVLQPFNGSEAPATFSHVQSSRSRGSGLRCKLITIPFAKKPRYEALSYTWGSEETKYTIQVNDQPFDIGMNLLAALAHLRPHNGAERFLWVDAICINQNDVVEKSKQISMMPWIYNRAQRVLVWLGQLEQREWTGWKAFCEGKELYTSTKGLDIALQELCEKEYWKRVWIIQEIGRARRVSVCFGDYTLEWKRFIKGLEEFKMLRTSAPMKLQRQLNEKYEDGHRFQSLVELHQDKLCKEARDHIYGFVGLAIDAQEGFPVDYEKSSYEVWKDVMIFKNQTEDAPMLDVLKFGKVVRDLLGGKDIADPKELELDVIYCTAELQKLQELYVKRERKVQAGTSHDVEEIEETKQLEEQTNNMATSPGDTTIEPSTSPPAWSTASSVSVPDSNTPIEPTKRPDISSLPKNIMLTVPACVAGKIVHFGPTLTQLHSDFKSALNWRSSINRWLPHQNRPMAREECDAFTELLEGMDDEELAKVGAIRRNIEWDREYIPASIDILDSFTEAAGIDNELICREGDDKEGEPRLFLIGGVNRYDKLAPGMMGLGPSAAQVGDYICQLQGLEKAVILRRKDLNMSIIGTAGLALSHHKIAARNASEEEVDLSCKFAVADNTERSNALYLHVDLPLAYDLLG